MAKKTSWGLIILGIAIFVVLVGVSLVAVAGYFVYQQFAFESLPANEQTARQRFETVAKRFEGQTPLLIIENGEPVVNKATHRRSRRPIDALHVMVWDPTDERVITLNIPFWLIRMTSGHPIRLSSGDRDTTTAPELHISADDLMRYGPGLILLHKDTSGERVIVWAQ
jgi:hypothetical protein